MYTLVAICGAIVAHVDARPGDHRWPLAYAGLTMMLGAALHRRAVELARATA